MLPKFRAWHKERKFMCDVRGLVWDSHHKVWDIHGADENKKFEFFIGTEIELMQWTGYKDTFGKDIFVGDIIQSQWGHYESGEPVKSLNELYGYIAESLVFPEECMILGNIYENSELLEQK